MIIYIWALMYSEITTETLHLSFNGKMLIAKIISGTEIDLHHIEENITATQTITGGKKYITLLLTYPFGSITNQAQQQPLDRKQYQNMIALAIVIHSLAERIFGNFVLRFRNYPCPRRLFTTQEEAIKWLNKEWDKSKRKNNFKGKNMSVLA